jgi:Holliday junction resolvase RusA-like endonuclease
MIFRIPVPPKPFARPCVIARWTDEARRRMEQQNVSQCLAYCGIYLAMPLPQHRRLFDLKLVLDLLVEMNVLIDDSQVDQIHVYRMPHADGAEAEVKVYPLEAPDGQRPYEHQIRR